MKYPYLNMAEVAKRGYVIKNAIIKRIDLNLIGHFGNIVTVEVMTSSGFVFSSYNATLHAGRVLQCLFDLLELTEEDGRRLSDIGDVPCRIIIGGSSNVGLGHFIEDKFIVEEDLFASFRAEENKEGN